MSAPRGSRIQRVVLTALLVALVPITARAQIGGMIRKAKAVVQKPDTGESSNAGAQDALTEQSVAALLRGLRAASARAADRDGFRAQQQADQTKLSALLEQHNGDQAHFDDATRRSQDCQADFLEKRNAARNDKTQAAAMALMSDPAKQQKYMQMVASFSQQMQAAQAKGDTAAVNALLRKQSDETMKLMGVDLHADTAAAVKACGAAPAKPAWLVEEETLRGQINQLDDRIRDAERRMGEDGARESGMTAATYAAMCERVLTWMNASENGNTPQGFSAAEQKVLSSHRADFNKVKNAL